MKIYRKCLVIGLTILFVGASFGASVEPLSCDAYGPNEGNIMEDIEFDGTATGGIPPYEYLWDYGDGNTSDGDPHPTHNYANAGNYTVILTVTDSVNDTASDTTWAYINAPPNKPVINGPTECKTGENYIYYASTTDPEGDDISYLFDWGDGGTSFIMGPYESGVECNASAIWFEKDEYEVKVQATDSFGAESEWSDPLLVTMPKTKTTNTLFITFLENHPNLFPLIRQILGL